MSRFICLIISILLCACSFKQERESYDHLIPQKSVRKKLQDTVRIEYNSPAFPNPRLLFECYNQYYADSNLINNDGRRFKTIKINILYNTNMEEIPEYKRFDFDNKPSYFKTLYNSNEADTLLLDAVFSTVRYYNEYFIIAFPKQREWADFEPPEDSNGYFLYNPIAFHLDTLNFLLTRMNHNHALEIPIRRFKKGSRNIIIYADNKYSFQFNRNFAFSKVKREFVFAKKKNE